MELADARTPLATKAVFKTIKFDEYSPAAACTVALGHNTGRFPYQQTLFNASLLRNKRS